MTTLAVRVPEPLLEGLDELVQQGLYKNRTEAVRAALHALTEAHSRRETDRAIVEGYRRHPPEPVDSGVDALAKRSIMQEPW